MSIEEQYQFLPSLTPSEYAALKADIAARGVMVAIEKDEAGNTLDGFHREQICRELNIDFPTKIRVGLSEDEKIHHALALNLERRHLDAEQRRELVLTLKKSRGWSNEVIGEVVGVSADTVDRDLNSVSAFAETELPRTVGKDGKSYPPRKPRTVHAKTQAETVIALDLLHDDGWVDDERTELDTTELKEEHRKTYAHERIEKQREEIAEKCQNLPEGKYSCIVIDPPWPMQKIEREERPNQIGFDYPTMSYEQLLKFPCGDFAADDCHLYLWTTHKHLPFSFELAEAWGFKYQCLMTWVKNVGMTPFSWMYSTEHVLFCKRGNLPLDRLGLRLDFNAKVRQHSRKPEEFYELVRRVSAEPRIDIFSREVRDGFESWGSEAGMFDETANAA